MFAVAYGSVCERVARDESSSASEDDRAAETVRGRPHRAGHALDEGERARRRPPRAMSATSRGPAVRRSTGGAGRTCTGRGSPLCARACRWRPAARPSSVVSAVSESSETWATVVDAGAAELTRGHAPDAPGELLHSKRVQNEVAVRRHQQEPVRLCHRACDLGQELRSRDADRDRNPTRSRTASRSRVAISSGEPESRRRPGTSRNASSIDRPSTSGVVSSNTR